MIGTEVWSKTLTTIKKNIGSGAFNSWISKIKLVDVNDNILKLSVNSNFIKDTVTAKYYEEILRAVKIYVPAITIIEITVDEEQFDSKDINIPGSLFSQTWKTEIKKNIKSDFANTRNPYKELNNNSILEKKFTFDNFVVDQPNEFAYAVAKTVAINEDVKFNPLFLYGGVGMGKTHLMQSIAWYKKNMQPNKKVLYVSAERFMYLFLKSLRLKENINFKELFSEVDILMIDDVQFLSGKNSTQEEFLYTFNKFVDGKRQVILAANKAPNDLCGVDNTLKSRLSGGLVVDVHPTTYTLREKILQNKAEKFNILVPQNVIEYLAKNITSNIRELEGALNRLIAHATLVNRKITLDMAKEVLSNVIQNSEPTITLQTIQRHVCGAFSISLSEMLSTTRIRTIATARQIAMYLSKELTEYSYSEIGKSFGNRDHSTVVHAVKNIRGRMSTDNDFNNNIKELRNSL